MATRPRPLRYWLEALRILASAPEGSRMVLGPSDARRLLDYLESLETRQRLATGHTDTIGKEDLK